MRNLSELRPYQQRIATHLYEHDEALCVVRPGGGKTISALTAIVDLLREGVIRHALIVAPKRVARSVWPQEIAEWAHTQGLRYAVLTGTPAERSATLKQAKERDITIVGIDLLQWLVEAVPGPNSHSPILDLLVLDEVSRLRSPTGKRAKALAHIASRWNMVWGLSGTLRPSSALDLFMPVRIVTRGKLWGRSYYQWRKPRFYPADYRGYVWEPFDEKAINAEIAPITVTLAENEMPQLPALSVIRDEVELPEEARAEYRRMERKLFAEVEGESVVAGSAAVATGKLAQLANGFLYPGEGAQEGPPHAVHEAKREWLQELVEDIRRPLLLVYEFRRDLDMMREVIGQGLPYLGAGVSDRVAARHIEDWNAGKLPHMALHPASGGHGLNLQHGGSDMAWIAPTWSPELWEQTIARLHRSGQRRPVIVRVCVAKNTVDAMKLARVDGKMTAQAAFEAYLREAQEGRK